MKNYTSQDLINKYNKLSSSKQVEILWAALDYMNAYNGRTRGDCVVLAMADLLDLYQKEENLFTKPKPKVLTVTE